MAGTITRQHVEKPARRCRELYHAFKRALRSHRRSFCERSATSFHARVARDMPKVARLARRIDVLHDKLITIERLLRAWLRSKGAIRRSRHIAIFWEWRDLCAQFEAKVVTGYAKVCTLFGCSSRKSVVSLNDIAARLYKNVDGASSSSYILYHH